jgi:hypothetical protein
MPLHVWLKEPPMQVLIKGDRIIPREWKKRKFGIFRKRMFVQADNGSDLLFDAANVLMVKTVTQEEIEQAKKRAEEAAKQGDRRVSTPPMMSIPRPRGH